MDDYSATSVIRSLRRHGNALLRGLLPTSCALCGGACDDNLCAACDAQFFSNAVRQERCARCANPLPSAGGQSDEGSSHGGGSCNDGGGSNDGSGSSYSNDAGSRQPQGRLCGSCIAAPPAFDVTLVAAEYAMPLDQLVLQLKFGHRLALAALLARLLRDAVLQHPGFVLPALLCPVPLGPQRLAGRGFNQALEIARPLARSLGVALHPRLACRVHETQAQSSVTPEQRQRNIAGAFAIPDAALVQGRHIGIVDDVMTSGRTLNELAATLKRHGAAKVSNLVFARTPPH